MGKVELNFLDTKISIEDSDIDDINGKVIYDDMEKTQEIPIIKSKKLDETKTDIFGDNNG